MEDSVNAREMKMTDDPNAPGVDNLPNCSTSGATNGAAAVREPFIGLSTRRNNVNYDRQKYKF